MFQIAGIVAQPNPIEIKHSIVAGYSIKYYCQISNLATLKLIYRGSSNRYSIISASIKKSAKHPNFCIEQQKKTYCEWVTQPCFQLQRSTESHLKWKKSFIFTLKFEMMMCHQIGLEYQAFAAEIEKPLAKSHFCILKNKRTQKETNTWSFTFMETRKY